ncbi:MAG: hypothetical protein FWE69_03455 [Clostridiales bacterium]|nr:hypothetical protein [Clostridiales bacterium]
MQKWKKVGTIAITALVVAAIALHLALMATASVGACHYTRVAEKAQTPMEPQEPQEFTEMVAALNQQARDANAIEDFFERQDAIDGVGESIQALLTSEYAALLTNDTFDGEALTVEISAYPLQNGGAIQRIRYELNSKSGYSDRAFLQYVGDTIFFSDIEYVWRDEGELQVFETKDGVFVFQLSHSDYSYTAFSRNREIKWPPRADVYAPGADGFSVGKNIEIPLTVDECDSVHLEQWGDTVRAMVYQYGDYRITEASKCLFDSETLSFVIPNERQTSEPVAYDLPGLLLGLSDSRGNLRTLFIRKEGGRILCDTYEEQIIFPRQDGLYALKNYKLYESWSEHIEEYNWREGILDFNKLLCGPLGEDQSAVMETIFSPKPEEDCYSVTDIPLYVGPEYVCYMQTREFSGYDASWSVGGDDIRFDRLDDLADFTFRPENSCHNAEILTPNFGQTTLAELVYGPKAKAFFPSDARSAGGEWEYPNPFTEMRQLALKRNCGKWSLALPVMKEYAYPWIDVYGSRIESFVVYSNTVPAFLLPDGGAGERETEDRGFWEERDLVSFPNSSVLLVMDDYYIAIGNRDEGPYYGSVALYIPVQIDEYIVSIHFADTDELAAWMDELSKI